MIGTVGSPDKARLAQDHGCHHPVLYDREDFVARVHEITDGRGLPVVYDSVGQSTFERSLDCLAPLGLMVSYGQASGPVPPFDPGLLARKGSLFLTRPTLATYIADRAALLAAARELFDVVRDGAVSIEIGQSYPLSDTRRAHEALESRQTRGSTRLVP